MIKLIKKAINLFLVACQNIIVVLNNNDIDFYVILFQQKCHLQLVIRLLNWSRMLTILFWYSNGSKLINKLKKFFA